MRLLQLQVRHFRSIQALSWRVDGHTTCLLGPGDSGKSTVLDALEWALTPRYTLPVTDADFFNADTSQPIEIEVTLGEVDPHLLSDEKFGLHKRGWSAAHGLRDEPGDEEDEDALTLRLRVTDALEPEWCVVNDRLGPDGIRISSRDRERLPVARVGADVERHLSWARGTALHRMTADMAGVPSVLAQASRAVREVAHQADLTALNKAAEEAQQAASRLGVQPARGFAAGIGMDAVGTGAGAMVLYDGRVPLSRAGLGTRRLTALALQQARLAAGTLVLVDEVEYALEPHRLLQLLRELVGHHDGGGEGGRGQALLTTHSPVVVAELPMGVLRVVRRGEGQTVVREVGAERAMQQVAQYSPQALLARSVIVCEGATEVGLLRALEAHWNGLRGASFALQGLAVMDGGGAQAAPRAHALAALGYRVCLFRDADTALAPALQQSLQAAGVHLVQWSDRLATETRVCEDLPLPLLEKLLAAACDAHGRELVLGLVNLKLPNRLQPRPATHALASWMQQGADAAALRKALGAAALDKRWFKSSHGGETLGGLVAQALADIPQSELARNLAALETWAYAAT